MKRSMVDLNARILNERYCRVDQRCKVLLYTFRATTLSFSPINRLKIVVIPLFCQFVQCEIL